MARRSASLLGFALSLLLVVAGVVHAGTNNIAGSLTAGGADCSVTGRCLTLGAISTGNGTVEVRGTFSATLLLECSIAAVSFTTVPITPLAGGASVTSLTAPGMWTFSGAFGVCRVRASAYTSGTATVDLLLTDARVPPTPATIGAAPSDAPFVTTAASAGLSAERVLTGTANQLTITDNGAESTVVLSIPATFIAPGTIAATTTVTGTQLVATTSATIGAATPTAITNLRVYAPSLTPTATAAAIGTVEQTFTVTGLTTADKVFVNSPAPTALCPPVTYRVSAADTLAVGFAVLTAAACTPAAGTYNVVAIRS